MEEKTVNESMDPVQIYLAEIRKLPPLTCQERQDLARKAVSGDREARERLLWDYLELVVSIAREYEGNGMHILDLIQAGNNGLTWIGRSFDWTLWEDFPEYAEAFIRRQIVREMDSMCIDRRIPTERLEIINRVVGAQRRLEQKLGRTPTKEEIKEELGISREETDSVIILDDAAFGDAGEAEEYENKSPARILYEMCQRRESTQSIRDYLAGQGYELSERQCDLLTLRFGLDGKEPKSLEQTAEIMGITRERVRQIENRFFRQMGHGRRHRRKIRDFYC